MWDILQMTFGVCFQEYFASKKKHNKPFSILKMTWVAATFFLTMAFSGNLKSSLTRRTYKEPTKTMNEIVDKDMIIHTAKVFHDYLLSPSGQSRPEVMRRVLCQARKKNFFFQNGYLL